MSVNNDEWIERHVRHFHVNAFIVCRAESTPRTLYVELAHGGHLGFYEGGLLYPNPVTWLDRAVVAIIGGIVLSSHGALYKKPSAGEPTAC